MSKAPAARVIAIQRMRNLPGGGQGSRRREHERLSYEGTRGSARGARDGRRVGHPSPAYGRTFHASRSTRASSRGPHKETKQGCYAQSCRGESPGNGFPAAGVRLLVQNGSLALLSQKSGRTLFASSRGPHENALQGQDGCLVEGHEVAVDLDRDRRGCPAAAFHQHPGGQSFVVPDRRPPMA